MPQADTTPDLLPLRAVHHVELYCGNAKQSAYYYRAAFGFALVGYKGPETGVRDRVSYALQQGRVRLVLTTPLRETQDIASYLALHGDGVRCIALETTDAALCHATAVAGGARSIAPPAPADDEHGGVTTASVAAYGDVVHTFVELREYHGPFLPSYVPMAVDTLARPTGLKHIDHVVGNVGWFEMERTVAMYETAFGLSRFATFDDKDISTEYTALRSTVVANGSRWIKFPINEPAQGMKRSQIEEYIQFNNGAGVQHVAIATDDIIATVGALRERGVEFLPTPRAYYDALPDRVGPIDEDVSTLAALDILVDRDDKGYLLQIFTKPVQDRPTLFYEVIQRKGAESFGKGNFRALFESIEREQARRGNL